MKGFRHWLCSDDPGAGAVDPMRGSAMRVSVPIALLYFRVSLKFLPFTDKHHQTRIARITACDHQRYVVTGGDRQTTPDSASNSWTRLPETGLRAEPKAVEFALFDLVNSAK